MTPNPSHVDTDELIETLERLEKGFLLPVSPSWLHDAIRHYARNVEWDMPDDGSALDRYAGSDVATVLNHLPALISALKENKRMRELNDEKTNAAILQAEWGAGYDHKVALAARAARHFGGQALVDYLNNTGSGNNAQLVRAFAAVGNTALQPQGEK